MASHAAGFAEVDHEFVWVKPIAPPVSVLPGQVRFRASCRKGFCATCPAKTNSACKCWTPMFLPCDEVWEGEHSKTDYVEHMTKLHGLSIYGNCGTPAPYRPTAQHVPKPGTLPPAGARRDAFLAAWETK